MAPGIKPGAIFILIPLLFLRPVSPGRSQGPRLSTALVAVTVVIQLILFNFSAQRIAMDTQLFRGARLIPMGGVEYFLDEAFFKFADGLVKQNPVVYHFSH